MVAVPSWTCEVCVRLLYNELCVHTWENSSAEYRVMLCLSAVPLPYFLVRPLCDCWLQKCRATNSRQLILLPFYSSQSWYMWYRIVRWTLSVKIPVKVALFCGGLQSDPNLKSLHRQLKLWSAEHPPPRCLYQTFALASALFCCKAFPCLPYRSSFVNV